MRLVQQTGGHVSLNARRVEDPPADLNSATWRGCGGRALSRQLLLSFSPHDVAGAERFHYYSCHVNQSPLAQHASAAVSIAVSSLRASASQPVSSFALARTLVASTTPPHRSRSKPRARASCLCGDVGLAIDSSAEPV